MPSLQATVERTTTNGTDRRRPPGLRALERLRDVAIRAARDQLITRRRPGS